MTQPAATSFAPFFLRQAGPRLRAARFDADPSVPPRGVCLLLNGQTEFIEKYFEVIDDLRVRGFAVVTFDWRGQGGSDRLLPDPLKAHVADFTDYDQDLALVMEEVVKPSLAGLPRGRSPDGGSARSTDQVRRAEGVKLIALAHSMGGHILLRRLHDIPREFSGAVLCAPMITVQPRAMPWWLVGAVARLIDRPAWSQDFVWGMAKRDHLTLPFAAQVVTSDPVRYARTHDMLAANPSLRLNGPTWGWLGAALKSIVALHAPGYAEHITTPSLLLGAGHDRVCSTASLRDFVRHMPHAVYVEIAGAAHEILMERDIYRMQFWRAFDTFFTAPDEEARA